jgi:hypothetical protein
MIPCPHSALTTCSSTTMDSPAVSRAPVEIWRYILQVALYDLEIFVIDPYDVHPSQFFNTLQRQYHTAPWAGGIYRLGPGRNDAYVQFMLFLSTICSVCKIWNALGQEFSNRVVSLYSDVMRGSLENQTTGMKRMGLAYKIHGDSFPCPCVCELAGQCGRCHRRRVTSQVTLPQIVTASGRVSARIMDGMHEGLLDTVLSSPNTFPNLISLILDMPVQQVPDMDHANHTPSVSRLLDYFDAISKNFSSLVYLGLNLWGSDMVPLHPNLNLPRLRSLDLTIRRIDLSASDWRLPALTTLNIREVPLDNQRFFETFIHIWPQIVYLCFIKAPRLPGILHIWTTLPRITALECHLLLILTYPPPLDYPLEYLSFVYYSTRDEASRLGRLCDILMEICFQLGHS